MQGILPFLSGSCLKTEVFKQLYFVKIDINLERINRLGVDSLAVLAEEVAYASESSEFNPETWNKMVAEENKMPVHGDRPHEQSAAIIKDQILREVAQNE